eukprot:SAG11_NODE_4121_length_2055_cov_3.667178_1_plen_131_part_00
MTFPPDLLSGGIFTVLSGPCTLAAEGRCVGRWPGGYLPNENCDILVVGGGVLGPCPVFTLSMGDIQGYHDIVTTPDGVEHVSQWCPAGTVLGPGHVTWQSNDHDQGSPVPGADGTFSSDGAGGGWQICFA